MKHVVCVLAALALASTGHAQNQTSDIQVQKVGDNAYVIALRSMTADSVAAAQQELLAEAKRICGSRPARFGKYQFEHRQPISRNAKKLPFLLKQEIQCVEEASAPTTVVTDPTWRPTAEQQRAVVELTERYFQFKDAGDFKQARTLLADTLAGEGWLTAAEQFNKQAGKLRHRVVNKITWYPKGPAPGVFVAVDYTGEFENIGIYCGYVVWHQGPDHGFRLLREEQNFVSREIEQRMGADELAAVRKKLRC